LGTVACPEIFNFLLAKQEKLPEDGKVSTMQVEATRPGQFCHGVVMIHTYDDGTTL